MNEQSVENDLIPEIEALQGVESAFLDEERGRLHLVLGRDHAQRSSPVEMEARSILVKHFSPEREEAPAIVVSYLGEAEARRRVRLVRWKLDHPHVRVLRATVTLEWQGREVTGSAEGAPSAAAVVRLAGEATLRAVERMVEERISFRLLGVKTVQAFDHELVVSLVLPNVEGAHRLPGVALVAKPDEISGGAVKSVLNATNRILGNYLTVD